MSLCVWGQLRSSIRLIFFAFVLLGNDYSTDWLEAASKNCMTMHQFIDLPSNATQRLTLTPTLLTLTDPN